MKSYFLLFFLLLGSILFSQGFALTNRRLIKYYDLVNRAELSIVDDNLTEAEKLYAEAFLTFKEPHGKDLYNSMMVSLKLQNPKGAFAKYSTLKCLEYKFEDEFLEKNFRRNHKYNKDNCTVNLDHAYKKTLDSLIELDQQYRLLSNGNYAKYKMELTKTDSIVATNLARLLEEKGFPNEYDIGMSGTIGGFAQKFYLIILHQLATNIWSSQKVNFSEYINNALNEGKISPEYAVFLLDLNNGKSQFFSKQFSINSFIFSNGSDVPIYDQVKNGTAVTDCCYVTEGFFPEKRHDTTKKRVLELNENRRKIGLGSIDDVLKKNIFSLDNKEFKFTEMSFEAHSFDRREDAKFLKDHMFKIN